MRIIAGEKGGLHFQPPASMPNTRPTTDLAKEGLFNVLENNLELPTRKTLDLFGGTGSISYELASRGVTDLTTVEKDRHMADYMKKTSAELGIDLNVHCMDVFSWITLCTEQFDLIFADPPYGMPNLDKLPGLIFEHGLLPPEGWFVLEHTRNIDFKNYSYYRSERNYGSTIFSIFINREELKK
jgi:16S rRNA (guanine(966)-N(2))-methyltransferase RsmD